MHTEIASIGQTTNPPGLETVAQKVQCHSMPVEKTPAVLVIEDEEILRLLVKELLEQTGYRPILACNGQEGLNIYTGQRSIAIVLTDLMMPVMDGHQTISALRQINPGVKIIAMSGSLEAAADLPDDI